MPAVSTRHIEPLLPVAGTTYTDSGSGTITLSGSATESKVGADSRTGTLTLSGSRSEARITVNTASGTVSLSGTKQSATIFSDGATGTINLSGSAVEGHGRLFFDTASGTVSISGTASDFYAVGPTSFTIDHILTEYPLGTVLGIYAGEPNGDVPHTAPIGSLTVTDDPALANLTVPGLTRGRYFAGAQVPRLFRPARGDPYFVSEWRFVSFIVS